MTASHDLGGPARQRVVLPVLAASGAAFLVLVILRMAVRAALPPWAVAVLAPLSVIGWVAATFRLLVVLGIIANDESGRPRPLLRRHGFWLIVIATLTALPTLGAFSLVDPWETHYAEVAREMIERRDFVSPWWANEGWFTSKPVLTFWLEAVSIRALGAATAPGEIVAGGARPEWAVRMPTFVLAVLGAYILYYGVSRTFSRRAAFVGGVVLWTMPGYALLSHQALTDMPLVASIAASTGMLLRAFGSDRDTEVPRAKLRIGQRDVEFHIGHLLAVVLFGFTIAQFVAIAVPHIHARTGLRFLIEDSLIAGSPHACGLPGHPACARVPVAVRRLPPLAQIALWLPLLIWLLSRLARETRASRLFAISAWAFAAFGAMAKGPAAFVIPACAGLFFLAEERKWRRLRELELLTGLGIAVLMLGPWYLAAFARHGRRVIDELVMRHMLGRTIEHLHDTNTGDDVGIAYFIKQLGYATFPWSGLAVLALVTLPLADRGALRARSRTLLFGGALAAFALVSLMRTKFHHYGLIALPSTAMLIGCWLDERVAQHGATRRSAASFAMCLGGALVVALIARDLTTPSDGDGSAGASRLMQLVTYRYDRRWPSVDSFAPFIIVIAAATMGGMVVLSSARYRRGALVFLSTCAILFGALMLNFYLVAAAKDGGQRSIFEAYEHSRSNAAGPLVAYQLNWKGENFYSGNDVAIFIASGAPMKTYLSERKTRGEGTVFFVTERARVPSLRAELGSVRSFEELVDRSKCYEFALVRAEL